MKGFGKSFGVFFVLSAIFVLSLVSVEGAVRSEARDAGYHNITYAERIQTVDDSPALQLLISCLII